MPIRSSTQGSSVTCGAAPGPMNVPSRRPHQDSVRRRATPRGVQGLGAGTADEVEFAWRCPLSAGDGSNALPSPLAPEDRD